MFSLSYFTVGCIISFFIVFYFSRAKQIPIPLEFQLNMSKCTKCVNYYESTLKGLIGMYALPPSYLICSVLSTLNSVRVKDDIDMEKKVLRKMIYLFFYFASFIVTIFLKNQTNAIVTVKAQLILMFLITTAVLSQFLFAVFCLRKIEADYDFDYIQLLSMEQDLTEQRL